MSRTPSFIATCQVTPYGHEGLVKILNRYVSMIRWRETNVGITRLPYGRAVPAEGAIGGSSSSIYILYDISTKGKESIGNK